MEIKPAAAIDPTSNTDHKVAEIQRDFPILARRIGDKRLAYLDNAATSQKPQAVLDAMDEYYRQHNANVHRGVHVLSEEATALYEAGAAQGRALYRRAQREADRLHPRHNRVASTWSPTRGARQPGAGR